MRNLAFIPLLLVLALSACGGRGKTLVVEESTRVAVPPAGLWDCPKAPEVPDGDYEQDAVANYILRLYQNHQRCFDSVEAVKAWLEEAKKGETAKK